MLLAYLSAFGSRTSARFPQRRLSGLLLAGVLALLVFGLAAPPAHAAGIVGSGTPASCTEAALDTAIIGPGSVTFDCGPNPATITLTSALNIYSDVTIDGGNLVTLSGGGTTTVIVVKGGANLNLNNITIANGFSGSDGGGIYNFGTLNVSNSTFTGNDATDGGAIFNAGTLNVTKSTFFQNTAKDGGAIYNGGSFTWSVADSTFSDNLSVEDGGAIYNIATGTLDLANSTFSGNKANVNGGAIFDDGVVNATNSTFSGNEGLSAGSALYRNSNTLTVKNSIVADSLHSPNCSGTISDGGHNIDSDGSCFSGGSMNDPKLDPAGLQNNGGPTQTIALLSSSPALGAGDTTACQNSPVSNVDQTGQTRIGGGDTTCDIGAFEGFLQPGAAFTVNTTDAVAYGACRSIYCPLRDSINAANQYNAKNGNPGATITLGSGETYALTDVDNTTAQGANGLPVIRSKITIEGHGSGIGRDTAVSSAFRIFQVNSGGTLNLNDATVANGSAAGSGGGLLNYGGVVNLDQTTFSYNVAKTGGAAAPTHSPSGLTPAGGGAIYNVGTLKVLASTLNLNSAAYGGAIDNGGTLTVANSTFTGNEATGLGGALFNGAGLANTVNDTLSGDGAHRGGEIANGGGVVRITNDIIALSEAGKNCYGSVTDGGHNLRWPSTDLTCAGRYGNPRLQPLADNGGPTQTMALSSGSPAINTGGKAACLASPVDNVDQRGVFRIILADVNCDIGAFEAK